MESIVVEDDVPVAELIPESASSRTAEELRKHAEQRQDAPVREGPFHVMNSHWFVACVSNADMNTLD